jgi:hypothetical protein
MEGVKYTVKLQNAPGASEPLHGGSPLLVLQSALFGPVMVAAVKVMVEDPTLVIVTDAEIWRPTGLLRFTGGGISTPAPVPDKATVCGLVASLSNTLRVPVE